MQYYVAKLVIGLQFYSLWKTGYEGQETANFISVHIKRIVAAGCHCPLHKIPVVTRGSANVGGHYQIYENCWFQRDEINSSIDDGLRLTAMTELLAEKKWSWDDVQRRLLSNIFLN